MHRKAAALYFVMIIGKKKPPITDAETAKKNAFRNFSYVKTFPR